ncbi:hypothetical protein OFC62_36475, partial [Escherichia coli]|nr:hypothetical protein [Escherichia coli]
GSGRYGPSDMVKSGKRAMVQVRKMNDPKPVQLFGKPLKVYPYVFQRKARGFFNSIFSKPREPRRQGSQRFFTTVD